MIINSDIRSPGRRWKFSEIRKGLEKFYVEKGRLPTALEFDVLDYLPSARQIQRKYGGLEKLRKRLGYTDVHFGKGIHRTRIAIAVNKSGYDSERIVEIFLKKKFKELFVHVEKQFGSGKTRLDFYVYNPTRNFGVDVISSNHFHNFVDNINHKIKRYEDFSELFYIVVFGDFTQARIDKYVKNRKSVLPAKCKIVKFEKFQNMIPSFNSYKMPIPEVNQDIISNK